MSSALERNFGCGRCGASGVVVIAAEMSKTPWKMVEDRMLAGREGMATQDDASHTLGLVRCPGCGERGRFAMVGSVARVIGYLIGGLLAVWIIGGRIVRWVLISQMPAGGWFLIMLALVALGVAIEVRRWRSAGRVSFLEVRPGSIEKTLPVAVARRVPKPSSPPPIEPVRTSAPEAIARASDADGPQFLKGE